MTETLGLRGPPGVARLLAVALVDRTGSGLFVPISVVYLHRTVGLSLTDIGLVLTLAGLVGTLAPWSRDDSSAGSTPAGWSRAAS